MFLISIKHSAVQNAFLAKYTFEHLSNSQKNIVITQTFDIMRRSGLLEQDFEVMCSILKFSFYALAMNDLGIKPKLRNERWHYVRNPYMALHNSDRHILVIKKALFKRHNVTIDMDKFQDIHEIYIKKIKAKN